MSNILQKSEYIIECLEKSGYEAYLVGGIVRDSIMKRDCHDADITTNARPWQVCDVFSSLRVIETGAKHGTVTVIYEGIAFEITTYRTEQGYSDSRRPDKVTFVTDLKEDLSRRDFTVNSLAFNPKTGFVDLFGGRSDIENKILRCVGEPEKRFDEDALRILRALRFSSELGFSIEEKTAQAAFLCREKLKLLSKERISSEIMRLLCGKNVRNVLLEYVDILSVVFPNLKKMQHFDQKNYHHCYDILEHTAAVVESVRAEPYMRLAALLHDYGKPDCFTVDETGTGHFYSHASIGAELAADKMKELKLDNNTAQKVYKLIKIHDSPIEETENSVKRKLNRYGEQTLRDLIALQRADNFGQSKEFRYRQKHFDKLERIIDEVLEKDACFSVKNLAVNGNDLKALGLKGREIGETLQMLVDEIIDTNVENVKESLIEYIRFKRNLMDS